MLSPNSSGTASASRRAMYWTTCTSLAGGTAASRAERRLDQGVRVRVDTGLVVLHPLRHADLRPLVSHHEHRELVGLPLLQLLDDLDGGLLVDLLRLGDLRVDVGVVEVRGQRRQRAAGGEP